MAEPLFDLTLDHGRCVAVPLGTVEAADPASTLLPEEQQLAASLGPVRRETWVGGRVAMRAALARLGADAPPILSDARGAPVLPPGLVGSREEHATIGVDVELDAGAPRRDIASRVLRPEELAEVEGMTVEERAREVLLRFSAKEAVYKALDPFVRRYVGFLEIAVKVDEKGRGEVTPYLAKGEGPFAFELRWLRRDGLVLTTARVSRWRD
jgi:4'-phosphopantetheinyl transferase EntD